MENHDVNEQAQPDEIKIPVNLEKYLQDNLKVFKFAGDVVNLYFTGLVRTGMDMITPTTYEFDKREKETDKED
ncbi:MAG TPA: hypothetical protein PKN57_06125 [Saprospiraceae bacterium]|jgi:hypothetical protein|nr:hypothetical protein [Saprospiraceae bacterium]MCC6689697.1 hypothetical protein [Saprospiraceae bacterium]HMV24909.1 hypothetical protein [Saprospiraceae bacterium]HMW75060.1 hypothetical protein [Saprospiraceae bacterium]HMX83889.1 hypothetical protein [Saprospiraceae bacterium]